MQKTLRISNGHRAINMKAKQLPSAFKRLQQIAVQCLGCGREWLVRGLKLNEMYICKECGHRFRIGSLRENASANAICRCGTIMIKSLPSKLAENGRRLVPENQVPEIISGPEPER